MSVIGVLALQGDFQEHKEVLESLGVEAREVRLPQDLEGLDGMIIPGGESTTIGRLMVEYGLREPLRHMAGEGFPIWGTCAGMILMAKDIGHDQLLLGCMDLVVERNAFGRQVDSFETELEVPQLEAVSPKEKGKKIHAVFIRAPLITSVGKGVEVLARLPEKNAPRHAEDHNIVAARQGNLLATAFHPELTGDHRFHHYFLDIVHQAKR
ncbi:MAG: pyridoxal 5'-phosphate synthase glutaminase subunit PdxT [Chloroflexi bacterium]|nr:pyridoxal 5'-phosphate synthase glutaminase subunit PdxT [Chloroflexota bacterium]